MPGLLDGVSKNIRKNDFNKFMSEVVAVIESNTDNSDYRLENVDDLWADNEDELDNAENGVSYEDQIDNDTDSEDIDNLDLENYEADEDYGSNTESIESAFEALLEMADDD